MRFLAAHNICLAQINPRGIRHLIGIYVLSRECGVDISTEHLSYLTDFRVRGRSDELKHSVTNASRMALIAGFPSKDDHFEDHFFFVELYEKTVEADCIGLVKTRWERRVKPSLPVVSKKFVTPMHDELSPGNGNWRRARVSSREHAVLEAAAVAKAMRSSGTDAPRAMVPTTTTSTATLMLARSSRSLAPKTPATLTLLLLPSLTLDELAMRHKLSEKRVRLSSGKGKDIDYVTSSKRQRVDTHLGVLSLLFDQHVGDYDEDKIKKDCDAKLAKLKSRCTKGEDEIASLKTQLSSASDLKSTRICEAVAKARDEIACGFAGRVSEVAGLLAEIGGKAHNNMLNLAEVEANLEFIGLLQGPTPPDLPTEIKALRERRRPIYDACYVFEDLLDSVRGVLEIPKVSAVGVETVGFDDEVDDEIDDKVDDEIDDEVNDEES
ncbi:hypothetical protein AALP_AA8G274900 [Arabis alpina]|uniref:DUF1204 domain-containing protein n=1 Tax=Arabis alpina TaxID=50452 RepID=A0A087G9U2_ARAAL|nr:hypothetical protein AALP_AA8G274900 [Arabis alpina]